MLHHAKDSLKEKGNARQPSKRKNFFWVLPKKSVLPCAFYLWNLVQKDYTSPFPFCFLLPFSKLALSFLLLCAKDSAHTCRVLHTNFATCEALKRTFPLPYTIPDLAVERNHAWGAPGGVFVHFNLVVTCPFWRQLQKRFSRSNFAPRSSNFVQTKEGVELFRLRAIRASRAACGLQKTLFSVGI